MMTREEAVKKACKLLRLAESCYPEEAALAAQRAQEILDRYELTRSMLTESGEAQAEPEEGIFDFGGGGPTGIQEPPLDDVGTRNRSVWKGRLAWVIARANACSTYNSDRYRNGEYRRTLEIIGHPSDVQKVRYLYMYLRNEIERLTTREGKGYGKTWRMNFRLGIIATISNKIYKARQEVRAAMREENANNPQALVRLDHAIQRLDQRTDAVSQWVKDHMSFKKAPSTHAREDYEAYARGRKAGEEIAISNARGALGTGAKTLRGGHD